MEVQRGGATPHTQKILAAVATECHETLLQPTPDQAGRDQGPDGACPSRDSILFFLILLFLIVLVVLVLVLLLVLLLHSHDSFGLMGWK